MRPPVRVEGDKLLDCMGAVVTSGYDVVTLRDALNDEWLGRIEVAIGLELMDWQKRYLCGDISCVPTTRCSGRTMAKVLRLCLTQQRVTLISRRPATRHTIERLHGLLAASKYITAEELCELKYQ